MAMSHSDGAGDGLVGHLTADSLPMPVFGLGTDATVVRMNAAAGAALGERDAIGRSWLEIFPALTREVWAEFRRTGEPLELEGAIGGRMFVITLTRDPANDAVLAFGFDVTEREEARQALAAQALELREYAAFPEMNPGPVCRLDLLGVVLRANASAHALFGEGLVGQSFLERVPQVTPREWARVVGEGARISVEVALGDAWIALVLVRAPDSAFVFAFGADVTALKAAESTLRELARFPELNPGPVLRLDEKATVLIGNEAARRLFGLADLRGRAWTELCPGVDQVLLDRVREGAETVRHETEVAGRYLLFTHAPGFGGKQVFVYGTDLTELKDAERALQQVERMATLGTLAAGVAHELNNPAAAVQRAAEHLANQMAKLQRAQLALNRLRLDDDALERLAELDAFARTRAEAPPDFDPVARSDREQDVELWLEDQEIEEAWDLAPALVGLGFGPGELEELGRAVGGERIGPIVTWLSHTFPAYSVFQEIKHGAGRISEIVSALKAYSYVDRAPVQAVDVNEGIRHTLIILQSKLKRGVAVELELDPALPTIEAYGGDLNQVWTNLIDNAIGAMGGEGRLIVRSGADGSGVRVEVEDDGPGIPADIQGRVFDPFFTTKGPGMGTGLGLNTTFNIVVKKHGGRIELDSRPGRTRFVVRLPALLGAGVAP